jgi:hypothetical protein
MVDEMHAIRGHGSQINWIEVTRSGQSGFGLSGLVSAGFNMTRQFVGNYRVDIFPNVQDRKSAGTMTIVLSNATISTSFFCRISPLGVRPMEAKGMITLP